MHSICFRFAPRAGMPNATFHKSLRQLRVLFSSLLAICKIAFTEYFEQNLRIKLLQSFSASQRTTHGTFFPLLNKKSLNVGRVSVSESGLTVELVLNWLPDDCSFIPMWFHRHLPDGLHLSVSGVRAVCDSPQSPAVFPAFPSLAFCSVNHWAVECWSWDTCWHFSQLCWRGFAVKWWPDLKWTKEDKHLLKWISTAFKWNNRRKETD